jgi:signal transduction histidine kinase
MLSKPGAIVNKISVLIVEDEPLIALETEEKIKDLGYQISSIVGTGAKAIKKAEIDRPDIVLMDIRLKGELDGIETAGIIHSRFQIPVVFATAYAEEKYLEKAKLTHPYGYLIKPVQERDLKVVLNMALYVAEVDRKREEAEDSLKKANEELEKKVQERTFDLQQSLEQLKQTQNELIYSEKMASLGSIVAGVAHEVSTPLGIVNTEASYLEEKSREINKEFETQTLTENNFKKFLNMTTKVSTSILRNSLCMSDQLQSFKEVSVDQSSDRLRVFKAKKYIEEILLNLRSKLKQTKHNITIDCPVELTLNSYPGAFSQIVTNFIMNTLNHGFEGIEEGEIALDLHSKDNKLFFNYKDNGIGMDEITVKQIFDPFFTTKRNEGGSGLGMNIVYNLVTQKLKGQIKCISSIGKGTEFIIEIPLEIQKTDLV